LTDSKTTIGEYEMGKTIFDDFLKSVKKDADFYVLLSAPAEDRGGTDKPCAVHIVKTLQDAVDFIEQTQIDDAGYINYYGNLFAVKDGILYGFDWESDSSDDYETKEISTELVLDECVSPDDAGSWTCLTGYSGSDDEDALDFKDGGYLVIHRDYDWITGELREKHLGYIKSARMAWTAFNDDRDNDYTRDIFKIENGKAELLMTSASIESPSTIDTIGFTQYDTGLNPSKECGYNCAFCYACETKDLSILPERAAGRVAIGTHCDPYSPNNRLITRDTLRQLTTLPNITKVGIFTRSPLVLNDIDLIEKLPDPVVHFTLSPYSDKYVIRLEGNGIATSLNITRIVAIKILTQAGIRVVINLCPCIPTISEDAINLPEFHEAYKLVDEICIGLICLYGKIPERLNKRVPTAQGLLKSRSWEIDFMARCKEVFKPYFDDKLIIWRDRTRLGWLNLKDNSRLPQEYYRA
jgi:DNA repair photolyase